MREKEGGGGRKGDEGEGERGREWGGGRKREEERDTEIKLEWCS